MTSKEAEEYLNRLGMFGIKLGLEQTGELFRRIGSPERGLRFIHLAGSNGKGSTAALLTSALRKAGLKTGFYSSPHLISLRERFRIDGRAISGDKLAELMSEIVPAVESMRAEGHCPTYFELTTAIAALCFAREKVDFVIWETGMGGRFDATNIVEPVCSIITGISLEHTDYLGDTIEKIAREKAGIIKPGRPVFYGRMPAAAAAVIRETATAAAAECVEAPSTADEITEICFDEESFTQSFRAGGHHIRLGLAGGVQRQNAILAMTVLTYLAGRFAFGLETALSGFADAIWPGRIQRLKHDLLVDGAHNPEGADVLVESLSCYYPGERFSFIFGNFADKDTGGILRRLLPVAAEFIFVPIAAERRSLSAEELCRCAGALGNCRTGTAGGLAEALAIPASARRVVCGSLYLAGELLSLLYGENAACDI